MKARWTMRMSVLALLALLSGAALAQRRNNDQTNPQFDDKSRQVARDWYSQHQAHPPVGLRNEDRLSTEEESRLQEGARLDAELQRKVHKAPSDLARRLSPPPRDHRYVTLGGHVGLIDKNYTVKAVIHLHDNH